MNEQRLKRWLQASDATATKHVLPPLDADHLERLVSRRRVRRRGITAASIASAVVAVAVLTTMSDRIRTDTGAMQRIAGNATRPVGPTVTDTQNLQPQLEALQREIDRRRVLVAALRQADELERLTSELAELEADLPDPMPTTSVRLAQAWNVAAALSLSYANVLASEFGEDQLAAAEYRTIVARYPATIWSDAAQRRLSSIPGSM